MWTWLHGLDYGDVPTWLASLGRVFALVFAAVAIHKTGELYTIESKRDERAENERRQRDEEQRRSQAHLISGWFDRKEPIEHDGLGTYGAFLLNRSDALIYEVQIEFYRSDRE